MCNKPTKLRFQSILTWKIFMLSKRYEPTEVDRRTWLHVPSGIPRSISSDTHQVVQIRKEIFIICIHHFKARILLGSKLVNLDRKLFESIVESIDILINEIIYNYFKVNIIFTLSDHKLYLHITHFKAGPRRFKQFKMILKLNLCLKAVYSI